MMNLSKTALMIFTVFLSLSLSAGPDDKVKIISLGWVTPTWKELAENPAPYEEEAPFDGLAFSLGVTCPMSSKIRFNYAAIEKTVKQVKEIPFKQYKNNFIITMIDQDDPNWMDDEAWEIISSNWGVAAKVAKEAGAVGLLFDSECYGVHPVSSYWRSEYFLKRDRKYTEEKYRQTARRRGQDTGRKIFQEFPDIVFLGLYLFSFRSDLMGEFCNGILDVMPPKARMLDGDEWNGYCASGKARYQAMKKSMDDGRGFLAREHRRKWRQQGGLAISFYMDAYVQSRKLNLVEALASAKNPVKLFAENLKYAQKNCAGFIWIYGESGTWWKKKSGKFKTWEEQLPGITKALFKDKFKR